MRSILGQEAANAAKEAAAASSGATSRRGRRSAAASKAASKRSSPKEESNKENRRRSTTTTAEAVTALGRLQSSAEDIVKNGDDPENAVVEVQFVTNQVPAKRVNAQLGELKESWKIAGFLCKFLRGLV